MVILFLSCVNFEEFCLYFVVYTYLSKLQADCVMLVAWWLSG